MGTSCVLLGTSCLPRKPRMSHRCMVVLHQDHQRCHGPQSQKSWSGTGTEDVKRELQELALHKTMSIWLIMGFINISVHPDRETANSVDHEGT